MLSLRRISHSASLRATGSDIAACACVASAGLALAHQFDDVFQRVLVGLRRRGRRGYRGRRHRFARLAAGRHAGGSPARAPAAQEQGAAVAASGGGGRAGCAAAGAAWSQRVLGTTLRAIGRGFGKGTFGLAQASARTTASPTASARLVASAVDRNAAARTEGSRLSSAAANHSIARALGLFD